MAAAETDVIARATASAMAEAVAAADVFCEADAGPDGTACGLSEANVRKVAEAQVRQSHACVCVACPAACGSRSVRRV